MGFGVSGAAGAAGEADPDVGGEEETAEDGDEFQATAGSMVTAGVVGVVGVVGGCTLGDFAKEPGSGLTKVG